MKDIAKPKARERIAQVKKYLSNHNVSLFSKIESCLFMYVCVKQFILHKKVIADIISWFKLSGVAEKCSAYILQP